jgi:hypothetical protein
MFPTISPPDTHAWKKLQSDQRVMKGIQLKNLFAEDRERFNILHHIWNILLTFQKPG